MKDKTESMCEEIEREGRERFQVERKKRKTKIAPRKKKVREGEREGERKGGWVRGIEREKEREGGRDREGERGG